ncbi:glycosyltransferase family 4 protein [Dickeya dianthicola]|uniref:Glycosyltransferase family 1 protein n=1 Tax=Dickeya dianthicola TaxID=204039 RepID=A0AAX1C102_9GAMM|nr:glycosyltransferase family 4 protein [Dickeya dianthicola]ATO35653.1 UDP-glucose:(heptosyl) LP alpha1,3-glucosyltransferase WaaG [Dickeya dianthicola RNS04.9]MBT1430342.1 glycosyltransferase family 4 protein [Dickeya dianthicola]MCA7005321.1 glycosyltransferase family 4 protein [Dickeya dianthicola]MCI4002564.1 glycosyltransferase family 4 protein [Dickeya dianthicola]MCI4030944.1 glycosyltransferase family 4 protein [Dickeya dianthicola]
MKLAIVRQKYRPDGGAERFVSRALDALSNHRSLDVSVITRSWDGAEQANRNVIICNPRITGRVQRESAFAQAAQQHFAAFDLVQSHERIPGCHVYRAGDGVHQSWLTQRARILNPLQRRLLWWSGFHRYVMAQEQAMYQHPSLKAVICNSQMVADEIRRYFGVPADKIHLIYNGVNTDTFTPGLRAAYRRDLREQLGVPPNAPVMLFVGSGFERKGLAGAIHAISGVPQHPHLMVVGKDKHSRRYQRLARRLGVAERVHFVGMQPDTRPYYGAADMLLLPTLYDPFPNVVLEAMASGLGVITSQQCGGKEFIQPGVNGFVCDSLDYDGLRQSVRQACETGFDGFGEQARAKVERYDLRFLSDNMLKLYEQLI